MRVHALTLTWNGADKLRKLQSGLCTNLMSICNAPEWHIKDNGSTDGTVEEINDWKSDVKCTVYEIGHNRDNFAQGVNYLFEKADPKDDDLVVLVNNDLEFPESNSLMKMYKLMKKTGAGVVGARLLYTGTDRLQHAGVIFGKRYGDMPYHFRHGEKSDKNAKKNRYFQAVTAACCLINPASFKRVGGFNNKLIWSFDDIDFNLRVGQKEKIAYCGEAKIYHEESASLNKNPINKLFLNHNVTYFKETWFGKYDLDHEKYLADPYYNEIK